MQVRDDSAEPTHPNWWILGGSLAFVLFTLIVGFGGLPYFDYDPGARVLAAT